MRPAASVGGGALGARAHRGLPSEAYGNPEQEQSKQTINIHGIPFRAILETRAKATASGPIDGPLGRCDGPAEDAVAHLSPQPD